MMSVSLCIIRISVNDNSPIPKSLSYSRGADAMAESPPLLSSSPPPTLMAKRHDALSDKPSVAWEKVDEDGRSHPILAKAESTEAILEKCIGKREETEIQIETYNVEERYEDECTDQIKEEPKPSYAKALAGVKETDKWRSSKERQSQINQSSTFKPVKGDSLCSDTTTTSEITSLDSTDEDSLSIDKDKGQSSESDKVQSTENKGQRSESKGQSLEGKAKKGEASGKSRPRVVPPVDSSVRHVSSSISPPTVSSEASEGGRSSKSPLTQIRRRITFFSGNPVVDVTKGIVHLFKENHMTSLDEGIIRSDMICALAVPASLICHDLLQFFSPLAEGIEHIRIVRDSNPNQYMTLIKFRNQSHADEFYKEYNGKPYNSFDDFVCYLVFVSRVECMKSCEGASLATPGLTELPTCNICLERMEDSVEGILTILCNHTFHGSCLTKWGDTSCPVCRYNQTPEPSVDNKCFQCGAQESLWICLICGHIGCGRYVEAHAYHHFEDTQHTYAMQLGKQRVWDYAGDNYVHRLVQSKGDGKPVEWERGDGQPECDEKFDSLTLEYTYLLNSQLESQRLYYEEKMTRIESDALAQVSEIEVRSRKLMEERDRVEREMQKSLKEKQLLDKKSSFMSDKLGKVLNQLSEELEMNKCLRANQADWQTKVTALEKRLDEDSKAKTEEIKDLKEQLRDLMFFLEAQETLNKTPDKTRQEIQEGQITIGASPSPDGHPGRRGRKKGK
ncbi:BRCA1-associated protein-like [Lytechinus pictus]|uniref:BRCA1-associated protein-like n=1 Tax=Lytechinus pictus TaxID=7653 RepID=UPI0030B9F4BC